MDLFTLDSQLRRTAVFDRYESLIWTERFAAYGDFEFLINSTLETRSILTPGTKVVINESTRVMTVETVEDSTDAEGRTLLSVKGPSLEESLNDRVATRQILGSTAEEAWTLGPSGPAGIPKYIFDYICASGVNNVGDKIPFLVNANIYPPDTIPAPEGSVTLKVKPTTVYNAIKEICEIYDLGFRLVRNGDLSQIMFNIYTGNDRTTLQNTLAPVVFAPSLDNLTDISYLTSISGYKNVAHVIAPAGAMLVYGEGVDPTTAGFERKVLLVEADDISLPAGAALNAALTQRGKEELAKNSNLAAFDGQIPQNGTYKYHRDYELGDIVEIRNNDGVTNNMRVTEQIFVSDAQGVRSYPTLAVKLLITPGSWYAWDSAQVWDDAVGYWDTV